MTANRWMLPATCLAVVLATGVAHGLFVSRWTTSNGMQIAADGLKNLPMQFGDWTATALELEESARKQTGTVGWYNVQLVNDKTGIKANVMLLCGQTRPLSVHPPTVCFLGMGLEIVGKESRVNMRSPDGNKSWGSFKWVDFKPTGETRIQALRTYWAWSRDGETWESPDLPRFSFSGAPYLYKIYVTRQIAATDEPNRDPRVGTRTAGSQDANDSELCETVLREFLPELHKVIAQNPSL